MSPFKGDISSNKFDTFNNDSRRFLPEAHVSLRNWLVLEHPHTRLESQLLLVHCHPRLVLIHHGPLLRPSKTPRPARAGKRLGRVEEARLEAGVRWEPLEGVGQAPGQHHAGVREEGVHARWQEAGVLELPALHGGGEERVGKVEGRGVGGEGGGGGGGGHGDGGGGVEEAGRLGRGGHYPGGREGGEWNSFLSDQSW